MINRVLYGQIKTYSRQYPILALTGPRQSGKTTLLKNMFPDYKYVTLENPDTREFALSDPRGFLTEYNGKIIFDEAQNAPELFSYIQGIVDEKQQMGQFILSGSQNFQLMERITQSLAGRVAIFKLLPFENQEMQSASWLSNDLSQVMTKGFYPAIFERNADADRYFANYLETYISRDVSQLVNVQDTTSFRNFVKLCATRSGQILNLSDLARDAGVSHTTARNWITVLETSFIVFQLTPYYKNYGKRLIKSPKLYFYDVGLLCHLLGIRKSKLSPTHSHWGHIFENMVLMELIKKDTHRDGSRTYHYWRDSKGHEVDILFEENDELHLFEIKGSSTIQNKMFQGMDYFSGISKESRPILKNLIYAGNEQQKRTDYNVAPWNSVNWQ